MNNQQAIKKIEEFGLHHAIRDLPNSALTVKAFETAASALEKQVPKEPKRNRYIMYCQTCGRKVRKNYDLYCSGCGQAIDWSEEEE